MGFSKGYLPCEVDEQGRMKPKYTAETILPKIEEYFEEYGSNKQTRSGLAVYLGITTETLRNYEKSEDPKMADIIKWAITRIEEGLELDLRNLPRGGNPTGTIFMLKNIAGWKDNQDVEVKGSGNFNIITNIPRPKED